MKSRVALCAAVAPRLHGAQTQCLPRPSGPRWRQRSCPGARHCRPPAVIDAPMDRSRRRRRVSVRHSRCRDRGCPPALSCHPNRARSRPRSVRGYGQESSGPCRDSDLHPAHAAGALARGTFDKQRVSRRPSCAGRARIRRSTTARPGVRSSVRLRRHSRLTDHPPPHADVASARSRPRRPPTVADNVFA